MNDGNGSFLKTLYDDFYEMYKDYNGRERNGSYEVIVSRDGKSVNCGTYGSKDEAIRAIVAWHVNTFIDNIIKSGEKIYDIKQSSEPGYYASKSGYVYNKFGKRMVRGTNRNGYKHAIINRKNMDIHRIIAKTFLDNPHNLRDINHIDGNKTNNEVKNLEWCTHSYNVRHAYKFGLERKKLGEDHPRHKLTNEAVKFIRDHYKKRDVEYGAIPLARKFGVDRTTILSVANGDTWKGETE